MVIDELVTRIAFDVPANCKSAMAGFEKSISSITDKLKSIGIVSAVTGGIFAAFSVNSADTAKAMANLSKSAGVAMNEIEALGNLYRMTGGDAKQFNADAAAFMQNFGQALDIDKMVDLSREFVGLSDQAAFQLGRSYGFSDDMIRTLMQGPDVLSQMAEEAKKFATKAEAMDNLLDLDRAWSGFKNISSSIVNEIQGALAPLLADGLNWLTDLLKENKEAIWQVSKSIVEGIRWIYDGIKETYNYVKPILLDWSESFIAWYTSTENFKYISNGIKRVKEAFEFAWEYIQGVDFSGIVTGIKETFTELVGKVDGFYGAINAAFEGGALQRIWGLIKEIATSPYVTYLTEGIWAMLKAAARTAFAYLNAGIEMATALVQPLFDAFEGVLSILSGIVNFDLEKTLIGFQKIGYALIDALKKAFLEVLPKLGTALLEMIVNLAGDIYAAVEKVIKPLMKGIEAAKETINFVGKGVKDTAKGVADTVSGWASGAWNWAFGNEEEKTQTARPRESLAPAKDVVDSVSALASGRDKKQTSTPRGGLGEDKKQTGWPRVSLAPVKQNLVSPTLEAQAVMTGTGAGDTYSNDMSHNSNLVNNTVTINNYGGQQDEGWLSGIYRTLFGGAYAAPSGM